MGRGIALNLFHCGKGKGHKRCLTGSAPYLGQSHQKPPDTNPLYEMAGAVWSPGKQGNAMSGNHQTNESLTLTLDS